jgi:ubiquinone/menaquinone biosynthesis C-methylase UbiE
MIKQDYNQLADAYGHNRKLHSLALNRLIEFGTLTTTSTVLEIGCGTGNYIRAIAAETGAMCQGVDPSREMLRIARHSNDSGQPEQGREHAGTTVTFVECAAERLPLPDGTFDLVFSVDVIHHIQRRDDAAREMFQVLKPGGVAVIVTESEDDIRHRTPQVMYFPNTIDVELQRYPTIGVIQRELADAGFTVADAIPVSMPHIVDDLGPYRDKAFSSLHLIPVEAFVAGIARMERDLLQGPIQGNRRYTMVVARRPAYRECWCFPEITF